MQGGPVPFIIDDILLTYIVLPYGTRLLDKGRNKLYDWLDSELGKEGKKLAKSMSKRNLSDAEALKELGRYVEEHRGTADTLATAAFAAELETASASGDEEFLRIVRDYFLTPTVEMAQALRRPAVLPGFLTGTDWLTAVDVRTIPPGEKLEKLYIYPQSGKNPARINLWSPLGPVGIQSWLPRLWLVRATDKELAGDLGTTPGKLAVALDEFARDRHTTPQRFAKTLEKQPFVTGITRDDVIADRARMPLDFTPDTTGNSYPIPWAESPAGVKTMRTALAAQLGDQQREVATWIQALKNLDA
jgi:hypothetical protein